MIDPEASIDEMIAAVRAIDPRLRVHFLNRNVETLVAVAAKISELGEPPKDIGERDIMLGKLASGSREGRDQLAKLVPSFDAFVRDVAEATRTHAVLGR